MIFVRTFNPPLQSNHSLPIYFSFLYDVMI